ncbi:hypothetical protein CgunFtcFv8_018732 [Champsocephalus gunnari]|uniref:Uncharacterized protein n=1 Tax=Champsocephalus gunnari TaxID=52237 RepID=A0AAN8GTI1_CHAGU|nr:hypothetical protein CgunFtcFv8_018732 [Champsocephalus gunnari]
MTSPATSSQCIDGLNGSDAMCVRAVRKDPPRTAPGGSVGLFQDLYNVVKVVSLQPASSPDRPQPLPPPNSHHHGNNDIIVGKGRWVPGSIYSSDEMDAESTEKERVGHTELESVRFI